MRVWLVGVGALCIAGCASSPAPKQATVPVSAPAKVEKAAPPPKPKTYDTDARGTVTAVAQTQLPKFMTATTGRVYWSTGAGELRSVPIGGGMAVILHQVEGGSRALAGVVASDDEAVYFATQLGMYRLSLEDERPELYIDVPDTLSVAVDERYLYVTRFGKSSIWRVNKDDGAPEVLVRRTKLPSSLTPHGEFLYWNSYGHGTVNRVHRDSRKKRVVAKSRRPTGLAIVGEYIVWASERGEVLTKELRSRRRRGRAIARGERNPDVFRSDGTYVYYGSWLPEGKGRIVRIAPIRGEIEVLADELRSPVGLEVVGDYVFVANKGEGTILRIEKTSRAPVP